MRTGKDYLTAIANDGRKVIHNGAAVADVTTHPSFRKMAAAVARYYDAQHDPKLAPLMTFEENGSTYPISYLLPRGKDDLRRRAAGFAAWAELTCGLMGRSPDYMNTCMASIFVWRDYLKNIDPAMGEKSERLYYECREKDRCLTHTFVTPFRDATVENQDLKVVRRDADGVYLSGTRGIATLAPFADGNLNLWGLPLLVDCNAPGLTWVCRDSLNVGQTTFDAPLSSRFDEMDCIGIFDDCFVPYENVIIPDPDSLQDFQRPVLRMLRRFASANLMHHVLIRQLVKARFILGIAHLVSESSKIGQFINVGMKIGEIVMVVRALEAFAVSAIDTPMIDPVSGLYFADPKVLAASNVFHSEAYPRMMHNLRQLCGSRSISAPPEATLDACGEMFDKHFGRENATARDMMGIFRLAADLCATSWGARQEIYEQLHFGSLDLNLVTIYRSAPDIDGCLALVKRMLRDDDA
jgi:4-hydroxyphenylacetate 3-monooxygenase